ncbi:MAG: cytochrome c, partial [Myxococcales bacterium]|nr:cytochrome c [Myxococcales bacterium]
MRRTWLLALCACVGPSMDPAGPDVDDTSGDSAPEVAPGEDDAVTWHADVRPIVERSCLAGCHEAGGVGPFSLEDDPADWARGRPNWAPLVVQAVASGAMPPWPASDDCHPLEGSRRLADDEVERFVAWERDGYLPGVPTRFVPGDPPEVIDLGTPDHLLDFGGAYRPDPARPDDYRCLLLGDPLTEDLLVRAIEVWPGERELVHHAILFEITPGAAADEVAARDAADPGPGFTCFGSPVVGADFFDSDQIFN